MRKLCTRWVTRVFTGQQKFERADVSQYNLDMFKRNPKEILHCFVPIDQLVLNFLFFKTIKKLYVASTIFTFIERIKSRMARGEEIKSKIWTKQLA